MASVASRAAEHLRRFNPCVASHELRMRMRGPRPFWLLFAYSSLASATVLFALLIATVGFHSGSASTGVGAIAFHVLVYTQLVLLVVALPIDAAGAITMEREKRTLSMLRITLLSAGDVVGGKFVVIVALAAMFLGATVPIAAWCMLLGGVEPLSVLYAYSYLLAVAAVLAGGGLLVSVLVQRTIAAIAVAYFILLVALVGVPAVYAAACAATSGGSDLHVAGTLAGLTLFGLSVVAISFVVFRLLRRPLPRWLGERCGAVAAVVLACAVTAGVGNLGSALIDATGMSKWAPLLLHPFIAVGVIVQGETARGFLSTGPSWRPGVDLQTPLWAGCTAAALLVALILCATATRAYRDRPD